MVFGVTRSKDEMKQGMSGKFNLFTVTRHLLYQIVKGGERKNCDLHQVLHLVGENQCAGVFSGLQGQDAHQCYN